MKLVRAAGLRVASVKKITEKINSVSITMANQDIRWQQRFSNFKKALLQLEKAVMLANERSLTEIEQQGLLKAFEFTHELAWNVMKDFFEYQGNVSIKGSRDAIREAFSTGLIDEGEIWMDTIKSRVQAVHAYDESTASEIAAKIINEYFSVFIDLKDKMESLAEEN